MGWLHTQLWLQGGQYRTRRSKYQPIQLRALPEPIGARPALHRRVWQRKECPATPGFPAPEGADKVSRLGDGPEVPLLFVCLDFECITRLGRPGGAGGEPELQLQ